MFDAQEIFENVLALVGHEVELGTRAEAKPLRGIIRNAMFDSLILDTGSPRVIRFEDLVYLNRAAKK